MSPCSARSPTGTTLMPGKRPSDHWTHRAGCIPHLPRLNAHEDRIDAPGFAVVGRRQRWLDQELSGWGFDMQAVIADRVQVLSARDENDVLTSTRKLGTKRTRRHLQPRRLRFASIVPRFVVNPD